MRSRPLSPHLSIYKVQISSSLSILHRITGVILFCGVLLLSWLMTVLLFHSIGLTFLGQDLTFLTNNFFFKLMLAGMIFSLYYHLLNGVRHLAWDIGVGYSIKAMVSTGYLVIFLTIVLTGITIYCGVSSI